MATIQSVIIVAMEDESPSFVATKMAEIKEVVSNPIAWAIGAFFGTFLLLGMLQMF